ncbi:hypothetical protein ACHHYP_10936 [Achlya hypogyna]|uniref:HRDC domain-containing protein n=1 Tax=Achlya hypogyna TaxID=1202772 RepID=A0A1V9YKB6_ACHHY|nr:hypothetical protein ACHHYP_10936 [Achlya hypogyna]
MVSSSWRDYVAATTRESVQQQIVSVLMRLKPNAPAAVLAKLPGMAARIEDSLFAMAASETEYVDEATLQRRMGEIQQKNASRLLKRPSPSAAAQARGRRLTDDQSKQLFTYLQAWRNKSVQEEGVGPWDIVPTHILAQVATTCPRSILELEQCCPGEHHWIQKYGSSLLLHIVQFEAKLPRQNLGPPEKRAKVASPRKPPPSPRAPRPLKKQVAIKPGIPPPSPGISSLFPAVPAFNGGLFPSSDNATPSPSGNGLTSFLRKSPKLSPAMTPIMPRVDASTAVAATTNAVTQLVSGAAYPPLAPPKTTSAGEPDDDVARLRALLAQVQQENAQLHNEVAYLRQQLRQQQANEAAACQALVACQTANVGPPTGRSKSAKSTVSPFA